jgi:hypothetical protein
MVGHTTWAWRLQRRWAASDIVRRRAAAATRGARRAPAAGVAGGACVRAGCRRRCWRVRHLAQRGGCQACRGSTRLARYASRRVRLSRRPNECVRARGLCVPKSVFLLHTTATRAHHTLVDLGRALSPAISPSLRRRRRRRGHRAVHNPACGGNLRCNGCHVIVTPG